MVSTKFFYKISNVYENSASNARCRFASGGHLGLDADRCFLNRLPDPRQALHSFKNHSACVRADLSGQANAPIPSKDANQNGISRQCFLTRANRTPALACVRVEFLIALCSTSYMYMCEDGTYLRHAVKHILSPRSPLYLSMITSFRLMAPTYM